MEIQFKKKDIADSIKTYYRRQGMNVEVSYDSTVNNADEIFSVTYSFNQEGSEKIITPIPMNMVSNILKELLADTGLDIISVNINYGGMKKEETIYIPRLQKLVVECKFKDELIKKDEKGRSI